MRRLPVTEWRVLTRILELYAEQHPHQRARAVVTRDVAQWARRQRFLPVNTFDWHYVEGVLQPLQAKCVLNPS